MDVGNAVGTFSGPLCLLGTLRAEAAGPCWGTGGKQNALRSLAMSA